MTFPCTISFVLCIAIPWLRYHHPIRPMDLNSQQKPHSQSAVTTIESLSDDSLADILVRLPSPASLDRAVLVCSRWRRLARSGDFLRRYQALHPCPRSLAVESTTILCSFLISNPSLT